MKSENECVECLTCGHPGLRPDGHAEWCEGIQSMTDDERNTRTVEMADRIGLRNVDNGTRYYR